MTKKTRVLVVDDSVVMRRHLTDMINREPDFEVATTAANGRMALQKLAVDTPDVVTMDVEMPEMDGLATLRELRVRWPRLPVVMCSSLTERGAAATLDALSAGANDYVAKPSSVPGRGSAPGAFAADLIQKLRALTSPGRQSFRERARGFVPPPAVAAVAKRPQGRSRIEIVAIGCSTGGPNALSELLPQLPADLGVPVVIVQHMPPLFTKLLAERLSKICQVPVEEATAGQPLRPGRVYLAPGDFHLEVVRSGLNVSTQLQKGPPENSCRPSVDVMLRSVVTCYGARVLGVILTGMGQDGLRGCELIAANGGQVLAQDEATSVVWGMPGFVSEAGLADETLPIGALAPAIVRRVRAANLASRPLAAEPVLS